ncbi:MAG: hypothetical protein OXE94_09735 [Aestuariivita sp.]|nr:hypothetical protein [Aestuariivita sp.]MCY4203897.1 hypothetical protein [Aestuariivita sp.]MCY4287876.1 hypothetical protein [Aestuariivita sp.]MCY4345551.1 hypothetical protein [Aestuariivita sp.]
MLHEFLLWFGSTLVIIGVGFLFWSVVRVIRVYRRDRSDALLFRAGIKSAVKINLMAIVISVLGLLTVVAGIILQ